jgi:Protein of unknown function (DUF3160)
MTRRQCITRSICVLITGSLISAACSTSRDTSAPFSAPDESVATTSPDTTDVIESTEANDATTQPTETLETSETSATTSSSGTTDSSDAATTSTTPVISRPPGGFHSLVAFAPFSGVAPLGDSPAYAGPPNPTSLDEVEMTEFRRGDVAARPALAALLTSNGFAVTDQSARFFHDVYELNSYEYETLFVTTDTAYNSWHLVFSKVLRDTEEQVLEPALADFLARMVTDARAQATTLAGTDLADSADRIVAYYEAAATLLGVDVGAISTIAGDEVALAEDASAVTTSPITGFQPCQLPDAFTGCVDYTQFLPRGHYTHSETLQRYFRAMSLLGQEAFYVSDPASLRLGLLAARLVTADSAATDAWQSIYDTTAFFVGVADDYTPTEVRTAAAAVVASGLDDPAALGDDATVNEIGDALLATRSVSIDPENSSVRVMGSRLVLDSYILDQLTWPNVGTDDNRRVTPSALDVASAFGSPLAGALQAGESDFDHYDDQLGEMQQLVDDRSPDQWAGTVYDAWLYALQPQFAERGGAYPDFMRSDAWAAKSLQTGLGSYTELKHDTILYAKQGTAGEGEGPTVPPYDPHHWVEPDPVAFGRLVALAQLTRDGLDQRHLLTGPNAELLDSFIELTGWLGGIAADELAGTVTSAADNDRLGGIGRELELLWYESSDLTEANGLIPGPDDDAALAADIFRSTSDYLELGVGTPTEILVLVPDGAGHFQLATGAVYSFYEFSRPADLPRLTDEEWRNVLATSPPPRPDWFAPIHAS